MKQSLKLLATGLLLTNILFVKVAEAFETDKPQYHTCYAVFLLNNSANYSQIFKTPPNADLESLSYYYLAEAIRSYNYSDRNIREKLLEGYQANCTDKPLPFDVVSDLQDDLLDVFREQGLKLVETKFSKY